MDQELVRQYEPVLHFTKGENFFPMRVEPYIQQCSLHVTAGNTEVMRIPPPYVDTQALAEFVTRDHFLVFADERIAEEEEVQLLRQWIDHQRQTTYRGPDFRRFLRDLKDKAEEAGLDLAKRFLPLGHPQAVFEQALSRYGGITANQPAYHYRVSEDAGYTVLQYWYFYAYNDFAISYGGVNDHEGDWEAVFIFLQDGEPVWTTYSSHIGKGKELGRAWGETKLQETHPVVYVAAGSHANYHTAEAHKPDKAFVTGDVIVGGLDGLPWSHREPLNRPWFTEFQGRWGGYRSDGLRERLVNMVGGPPTGPRFDRDGQERPQWHAPARFAGLV